MLETHAGLYRHICFSQVFCLYLYFMLYYCYGYYSLFVQECPTRRQISDYISKFAWHEGAKPFFRAIDCLCTTQQSTYLGKCQSLALPLPLDSGADAKHDC